jgi:hypothetical protein
VGAQRRLGRVGYGRALALVAALAVAGGASASDAEVYRLSVRAEPAVEPMAVEWVDPSTGQWRLEQADNVSIYDGARSFARIRGDDVYVRTGSPRFLQPVANGTVTRAALIAYRSGNPGAHGVTVTTTPAGKTELRFIRGIARLAATIEETIPAGEANRLGLFRVPRERATNSDTERPVGAPPLLAVKAYWFGRRFGSSRATQVVEHFDRRRGLTTTVYDVFYGGARGFQVVSQPVKSWAAQRAIQAFNGRNGDLRYKPWPRWRVRLRNGETVTVVRELGENAGPGRSRFSVIAKSTLVSVTGSFANARIPAVARLLRPVGA